MFEGVLNESILKRAIECGALDVRLYNIRDFAKNKHHQVDDYPFGGGAGMLMMPQPAFDCIQQATQDGNGKARRIYFFAQRQTPDDGFGTRIVKG